MHILKHYKIELLIDIRTIPKSRHVPQFNKENLTKQLKKHKIAYLHLEELGGLRHAKKDSINVGWKNLSFRGYADYMQTPDFEEGLDMLMKKARGKATAIMCAEAVPWRCHRSLVADALLVRGYNVTHILSETSSREHLLTPWAVAKGLKIIYPKSA